MKANGYQAPPPTRSGPLYDANAERCTLGSMLRDNRCIGDVVRSLRIEDFYPDSHQRIGRAIVGLWDKGKPVDLVTLADVLKNRGEIDDIGGYDYLGGLWDCSPTAANVTHYANIVREDSIRRQMVQAGDQVQQLAAKRSGPAEEALAEAERLVLEIAQVGAAGETFELDAVIGQTYDRIDERQANALGAMTGIDTGFIDLNNLTSGWQKGELIILAGRPSSGKTAMALNLFRHAVKAGVKVFFVSLEQSRVELMERLLCCEALVDYHRLRKGMLNSEEMDRLMQAGGTFRTMKSFIDDTACQTMLRISANARRLKQRHGLGLVIIDYLQLIDPEDSRAKREEQVAAISRKLKQIARELKVPVIALAQLNRELEARAGHRPRTSDLRESGSIEANADVVAFTHRPEMFVENGPDGRPIAPERPGEIDIIVGKQRNGPTGDVTLYFRKEFMRFENFAVADAASPFAG